MPICEKLTKILSIYKNNLCILMKFNIDDDVYLDLYKGSLKIFKTAKNIKYKYTHKKL